MLDYTIIALEIKLFAFSLQLVIHLQNNLTTTKQIILLKGIKTFFIELFLKLANFS